MLNTKHCGKTVFKKHSLKKHWFIAFLQRPRVVGNITPILQTRKLIHQEMKYLAISHVIKTGAQQKLNFCNQNPVLLTILSLWGFVNWNYSWPSGCWHISSGLMEWEPIHNLSQKKKYFLHLNPWQLNPLAAAVGMMWEEKWHVCEYYIIFGSIKWIFILKVVAGILSGLAGCQGQLNFSTKPFGFIQAF